MDQYTQRLQTIAHFLMGESKLSVPQIAQEARVPIRELLDSLSNPSLEVYQKVIEGLGVDFHTLQTVLKFRDSTPNLFKLISKLQEVEELITPIISEPAVPKPTTCIKDMTAGKITVVSPPSVPVRKTKQERLVQEYVGRILRRLRESRNWSQVELARRMNIHQSSVSGLERGIYSLRNSDTFRTAFSEVGLNLVGLIAEAEGSSKVKAEENYSEDELFSMVGKMKGNKYLSFFQDEFKEQMGTELKKQRMMQGLTVIEACTKCKVSIEEYESIEEARRELPASPAEARIWRKVMKGFQIPFDDLLFVWTQDKLTHTL